MLTKPLKVRDIKDRIKISIIKSIPYAREKTDLSKMTYLNRAPQLSNSYICVIFGCISKRERYLGSFIEILYAFLQFESSKSGPKNVKKE